MSADGMVTSRPLPPHQTERVIRASTFEPAPALRSAPHVPGPPRTTLQRICEPSPHEYRAAVTDSRPTVTGPWSADHSCPAVPGGGQAEEDADASQCVGPWRLDHADRGCLQRWRHAGAEQRRW